MSTKSVIIKEENHNILKELSEKLQKPIGQVVEQCILYISKNGVNPFFIEKSKSDNLSMELQKVLTEKFLEMEQTKSNPLIESNKALLDSLYSPEGIPLKFDIGEIIKKSIYQLEKVESSIYGLNKKFLEAVIDINDYTRIIEFHRDRYMKLKHVIKCVEDEIGDFQGYDPYNPDMRPYEKRVSELLKKIEKLVKYHDY